MEPNMIILILLAVISVILILSVVHISGKTDEMANRLGEIKDLLARSASGWTCPKCGKVNSDSQQYCTGCSEVRKK